MFAGKTWWVVGASAGLGAEIARALAEEGARVIVSARSAEPLSALAEKLGSARALPFDVTDPELVSAAVEAAGEVDGLVYCVGQYVPMTAQDWLPEVSVATAEANYVGALRLLGHVAPTMANRRKGKIVLIGSLSGFVGLPGAIGYGSSKAALMHLAADMRADLRGAGVQVQMVNPGYIRTRLTEKNGFAMPQILEPEEAAARVIAAIRTGRFSTSFPKPFSLVFTLGRFLPTAVFQRLL